MCGICGIYNFDRKPVAMEDLDAMANTLRHRGPDGSGSFLSGPVGLGHRRLSIIDLEGGSQPLSNEDSSLQVVFNGEIYNFIELRAELQKAGHQFKTLSDTEVIVHGYEQWGVDCVTHFNGIFAFALWDDKQRRLFLARDHLGVKPLYYARFGSRFVFGSEIKPLILNNPDAKEMDLASLSELFTFRYVPSPRTLFKGISKLPPGHCMVVNENGITQSRFWKRPPTHRQGTNENEAIETYQSLLEDAIRLQLRSDVPVGLFLSSGVDSGALLAIMRQHLSGPIHTFTIGFEGGQRTNETDDARHLARMFDAKHTEMIIGPADYEKYFERYMGDIEEPVGNETAAAFYFVSMLASRQVKVALTGQGADEPWAGYQRYVGVKLSEYYRRLPRYLTDGVIKKAVLALPGNERLKRGVVSLNESETLTRFGKIYSFFSADMKAHLFQDWVKDDLARRGYEPVDVLAPLQQEVQQLDPVSQMLYIDTRASLPDDLLMVNDKTSMANSLEARVPFLDYRLVEFIESLPAHYKLRFLTGKYLHKKAIEKWLPDSVVYRPKKGFDNPIKHWLREKMQSYVDECLFSGESCIRQFFNVDYVRRMVELHKQKKENYMRHLYLLISLEMWHRRFIRS